MAATVTVRFDTSKFSKALAALKDGGARAAARAVSRATNSTRVLMARSVAKDLGIKAGDANKAITTRLERGENRVVQSGQVVSRGARIPLLAFAARGPEPSRGRGRGVTAKVGTSRTQYPKAFIATMPTGHRGVFMRAKPPQRLPIRELYGPSITHVFIKYIPLGVARGQEQLEKNLAHEIQFELSKLTA